MVDWQTSEGENAAISWLARISAALGDYSTALSRHQSDLFDGATARMHAFEMCLETWMMASTTVSVFPVPGGPNMMNGGRSAVPLRLRMCATAAFWNMLSR